LKDLQSDGGVTMLNGEVQQARAMRTDAGAVVRPDFKSGPKMTFVNRRAGVGRQHRHVDQGTRAQQNPKILVACRKALKSHGRTLDQHAPLPDNLDRPVKLPHTVPVVRTMTIRQPIVSLPRTVQTRLLFLLLAIHQGVSFSPNPRLAPCLANNGGTRLRRLLRRLLHVGRFLAPTRRLNSRFGQIGRSSVTIIAYRWAIIIYRWAIIARWSSIQRRGIS
jgi:hypothetical protein